MCSTRANLWLLKLLKRLENLLLAVLAHPGGLESWQPSGRWQWALGAEHLQNQTKRQEVK